MDAMNRKPWQGSASRIEHREVDNHLRSGIDNALELGTDDDSADGFAHSIWIDSGNQR